MEKDLDKALSVDEEEVQNYDLSLPPVSGSEYLYRVQLEAKSFPDVVIADMDIETLNKKQTIQVQSGSGLQPAPSGYTPSLAWQQKQVLNFSEVRQKFTQEKAIQRKKSNKKSAPKLPAKEDIDGWCQFCFGRLHPNATSNTNMPPSAENDSAHMESPSECKSPVLSVVSFMDQPTVIQVLEYHINWFEATGFTHHQGRWLYALLVCLEKPLDPECCSLLRTLARNCANLRATLSSSSHSFLTPLNLFISLVSRYFDQGDLADN